MIEHGPSLQEASKWVQELRGQLVLVKVGGEMLASRAILNRLAKQIPVLVRVGLRPILVHGAGVQVDGECRSRGIEIVKHGGRRVTTPETLGVLVEVLHGLNQNIITCLKAEGIEAFGMDEEVQRSVVCLRRPQTEVDGVKVDWGMVGDVQRVDPSALIQDGPWRVPVLPSLGTDEHGEFVNVNADSAASLAACSLGVAKLLLLTGAPGVMGSVDDAGPISQMTAADAHQLIDRGIAKAGMKAKLEESLRALEGGVPAVHILSGKEQHTLLRELFTDEGCGTLISAK